MSNLPDNCSDRDLDNHYGDGSAICDDCERKIPEGEEIDTDIPSACGIGNLTLCRECKEARDGV